MKNLVGLTLAELRDVVAEVQLRPFAAKQIAAWIYKKRVFDIERMTDLPKEARHRLAQNYTAALSAPIGEAVSSDGTVKYLFEGVNGRDIESVFIPDKERATLCVSSQAGCKMNCSFCMTGRGGFNGDLSTFAIMNQILAVDRSDDLTNIVFMGMGEPLDNLPAVLRAIEILTADWGLAWSPKRITVSSIGKLAELKKLLDGTKVHIAISLHNPFPAERAEIMPVERAYSIIDVVDLLGEYDFSHQRRLSFEYIMWKGVNDSPRYSAALAKLIGRLDCRVNLIRFHAIPGSDLKPSDRPTMEAFRDYLNSKGITATIRASRGEDIMAACGMLAGAKNSETKN